MSNEKPTNKSHKESFQFQAEVARVLDIVINSLYTDKEIFVRELISNAVDASEKRRYHHLVNGADSDETTLEIGIKLDEDAKSFTISDAGIGMTRDELIANLGNIAHSGAAEFLKRATEAEKNDINLIGQFGVGFYSAFMVANKVTVRTRSVTDSEQGWIWESDGITDYTLEAGDGIPVGTSIELHLKEDAAEFASDWRIKSIIQNYSGFVPFPVKLNDETVNTVQAIWTKNSSEVTDDEYKEFFKHTNPMAGDAIDWIHFSTDAPLAIKALLFIPSDNPERFGLGRVESNVNLYCRKILIQRSAKDLLPQWLRFVHGVVDSEDIPLNISRETMQDSALIRKINRVLTKRILKYFKNTAQKNPETYQKIWEMFGAFLKEGIVSDFTDRDPLSELLRFESSMTETGTLTSLAEYLERMPESQTEIYYITGANREAIESGPYVEVFKRKGIEVIYNFDPIDDFVMHHLAEYKEKKLISADSESINLPDTPEDKTSESDAEESKADSIDDVPAMTDWIRSKLQDKVSEVKPSTRLVTSPMILVNPEGAMSGAMQKLMEAANRDFAPESKRNLQFNPDHQIIRKLNTLKSNDEEKAVMVLEQLYDHAALDAGLSVETRSLVNRVNTIIEQMLD